MWSRVSHSAGFYIARQKKKQGVSVSTGSRGVFPFILASASMYNSKWEAGLKQGASPAMLYRTL